MVVVLVTIEPLLADEVNSCSSSRSRRISLLAAERSPWSESSRSLSRLMSRWHVCEENWVKELSDKIAARFFMLTTFCLNKSNLSHFSFVISCLSSSTSFWCTSCWSLVIWLCLISWLLVNCACSDDDIDPNPGSLSLYRCSLSLIGSSSTLYKLELSLCCSFETCIDSPLLLLLLCTVGCDSCCWSWWWWEIAWGVGKDCWCGSLFSDAGDFFSKVAIDELDDEKLLDFEDGARFIWNQKRKSKLADVAWVYFKVCVRAGNEIFSHLKDFKANVWLLDFLNEQQGNDLNKKKTSREIAKNKKREFSSIIPNYWLICFICLLALMSLKADSIKVRQTCTVLGDEKYSVFVFVSCDCCYSKAL